MRSTISRWLLAAALCAVTALPALATSGYLGVTTRATDADLRRGLDLTRDGLLVNDVEDDSPADRAGIQKGDVILSFNSRSVSDPSELRQLVRQTESGRTVSISVWRDGERRSLDVKLGAVPDGGDDLGEVPAPPIPSTTPRYPRAPRAPRAPETPEAPRRIEIHGDRDHDGGSGSTQRRVIIDGKEIPESEIDEALKGLDLQMFDGDGQLDARKLQGLVKRKRLEGMEGMEGMRGWGGDRGSRSFMSAPSRGRLGVRVDKLSDEMRDALGANGDEGVLVLEVMGDTPAQRAGMRAGDIIVKIDDDAVDSPDGLVKVLRGHEGDKVQVRVLRKGLTKTLEAELEAGDSEGIVRGRVAPRIRTFRGNPEPGQGGQGYRGKTKNDAGDDSELRDEIDELRRELRELREQLKEKK